MADSSRKEDEYLTNYIFEVQFGKKIKLNFSKVSNISSEVEYDVIGDGGNNDRMYFFQKPNRKPSTIIFERGMKKGKDTGFSSIVEGLKVYNIMILVKKGICIERVFFIEEGMVTRMSYTDLDAVHGEILIKRMEIQHTGIEEVSIL